MPAELIMEHGQVRTRLTPDTKEVQPMGKNELPVDRDALLKDLKDSLQYSKDLLVSALETANAYEKEVAEKEARIKAISQGE